MSLIMINDLAQVGIVEDANTILLPPNAWTKGKNIRFTEGSVEKFLGHTSVATPSVEPYWLIPVTKGSDAYWVYFGLDKAYSFNGTTHTPITRQTTGVDVDYTGLATDIWTGGVLNGVLVANNGVDDPQMWVSTKLQSLQWDNSNTWAAKGYTANAMRPYRNFLVALGWNDGSNNYPHTVYWSNQADPLTVPSSWDYADATNDSGLVELASTSGFIIDGAQLRDQFIIYKEDAMHLMQFVGGAFIHNFRDISLTTGMIAKKCVKEFFGRHAVFGNDDIFIHDGQTIESIAAKRVRKTIYSAIDPTNYIKSYVVRNLAKSELWFCFPETGSTDVNRAAIWNWKDNTWAHRELPSARHIGYGILFDSSDAADWASDSDSWDSDTTTWANRAYNPTAQILLAATASNIHQLDTTTTFNDSAIDSYVVREGLVLDNIESIKRVQRIYPRATGGTMQISIGSQMDASEAITWEGPYSFTPGSDSKVDVRSTGRLHSIKFTFPGSTVGSLQGYDLEYVQVGRR